MKSVKAYNICVQGGTLRNKAMCLVTIHPSSLYCFDQKHKHEDLHNQGSSVYSTAVHCSGDNNRAVIRMSHNDTLQQHVATEPSNSINGKYCAACPAGPAAAGFLLCRQP